MTRILRRRWHDDRGVALVVAISVTAIGLTLASLAITVAIRQTRATGVDRQRNVAINAAEAGVDASFNAIQAAGLVLPCVWPATGTADVQAYPDRATLQATITYYNAAGSLTCAQVQSGALVPTSAKIKATAVTNTLGGGTSKGHRAMESDIKLTPSGNGMNSAIFSNGALTVKGNHLVRGNVGADADVYSNASITCASGSNQTYQGSIFSQGSIALTGLCSVLGDIWALDSVTLSQPAITVGGRAMSSASSVALISPDKVAGLIMAGGGITPLTCIAPKCIRGFPQPAPPAQPFPQIKISLLSEWYAAPPIGGGFTEVLYTGACGQVAGDWIAAQIPNYTVPTLIRTSCQVAFKSSGSILMKSNIAIFADGGFTSKGTVKFVSDTAGSKRNLYFVVPYDSPGICPVGDITTDNRFSVSGDVDLLLYTKCKITIENQSDLSGQIYAGTTLTISNHFDMQFRKVPTWGVDPASLPTVSYKVADVHKREVRP